MYEQEIKFLEASEDLSDKTNGQRTIYTKENVSKLIAKFPGLPTDYIQYLEEIGCGPFRECQFEILNEPCYFEELYDVGVTFELKRYVAFGINFSGDTSLFDSKQGYEVVEFWHESHEFQYERISYKKYIRDRMLIGDNGSDLRENA